MMVMINSVVSYVQVYTKIWSANFMWTVQKWNFKVYSIVYVAKVTTKTSNFTCQSKSFISIFFTFQVSACELQPFSCLDLENDIQHSQTAKTV